MSHVGSYSKLAFQLILVMTFQSNLTQTVSSSVSQAVVLLSHREGLSCTIPSSLSPDDRLLNSVNGSERK